MLPTDVQAVAKDVMAHRIVLGFDAVADNITTAQVIERIVAMVPPPTPVWNHGQQRQLGNRSTSRPHAPSRIRRQPAPAARLPAAGPYQQPVQGQPNQPDFH